MVANKRGQWYGHFSVFLLVMNDVDVRDVRILLNSNGNKTQDSKGCSDQLNVVENCWSGVLGPVSISDNTSYRKIS